MKKIKFINKPFDEEERALMEAVENGKTRKVGREELQRLKTKLCGARNVTIHMQNEDIEGMKKKAEEAGLPYQTLINTIIHRYLNGGVILKKAF
ncbi:MAG: hypothetical protein MJY78_09180 [Fibrobacter sp.]|nr:hypothetical protein [Fibrobacter sp.]